MKKYLTLFMIISTLCAFSQDTTSYQLTDAVVTGVRFNSEKTISQITIKSDKIKETYFGQDLPVIFNFISPSITFYSDGGNYNGYMYYRLRGIDQTRINSTLNGVPLNEPEDQGAYFSNYPDFSANVSSVQIQRGVGTSSNGTSSFAGSINFESPNLLDSGYNRIEYGVGSFNTNRFSVSTNTGLRNKFALYTRYTNINSDGYRDNSGTKGNTLFISGGFFGKKNSVKFTSFIGHTQNQMAWMPSDEYHLNANRKYNPLSPNETDNFTQNLNMLSYNHYFDNKQVVFNNTTFYNYLTGKYGVLVSPTLYQYMLESNYLGNNSTLSINKRKSKIILGANFSTYNRNHKSSISPDDNTFLYSNTGFKNEMSSFIKYSIQVKKLLMYTDIQYRIVNFRYSGDANLGSIQWQFLNPKVGVSYQVNDKFNVYSFLGRSHREPTRDAMFAGNDNVDNTNISDVESLSKVKPETVTNFEAGINYVSTNFNMQLNYYDMRFKNEIAPIGQLSTIGMPLYKNIDNSLRTGFELMSSYKVSHLEFNLGASYNYSQIKSYYSDVESKQYNNVTPLLTPQYLVNSGVTFVTSRVNVSLTHKFISSSYLTNTNDNSSMLPKSNVVNFSSKLKANNHLSFVVSVNNILNSQYYNSGLSMGTFNAYFVAPTRNYFVTAILTL